MSKSAPFLRRHLFVDPNVQTELLRRLAIYAVAATVYFVTIVVIEQIMLHRDRAVSDILKSTLDQSIFWLPGLLMLGPLMMYDLLKVTNRFAGPMYSLRCEMRRLVDGKSRRPVRFRKSDHWNEMAISFNALRKEIIELRRFRAEYGHLETADADPSSQEPNSSSAPA